MDYLTLLKRHTWVVAWWEQELNLGTEPALIHTIKIKLLKRSDSCDFILYIQVAVILLFNIYGLFSVLTKSSCIFNCSIPYLFLLQLEVNYLCFVFIWTVSYLSCNTLEEQFIWQKLCGLVSWFVTSIKYDKMFTAHISITTLKISYLWLFETLNMLMKY